MRLPRAFAPAVVLGVTATLIALFALVAVPSSPAMAHASLTSSDPAANSVVKSAPTKITMTFAQPLDPKGPSIAVYNNKNEVVSTGAAVIDPANPKKASIAMKATEDS